MKISPALKFLLLFVLMTLLARVIELKQIDWRIAQLAAALCSMLVVGAVALVAKPSGNRVRWWWLIYVSLSSVVLSAGTEALYLNAWREAFTAAALAGAGTLVLVWFWALKSLPVFYDGAKSSGAENSGSVLRSIAAFVVLSLFAARLIFSPLINLLTEEAYYWKYAEQLDIGYLDHPPAVAVLIALGEAAFGVGEFGVRIGATLCWLVMAYFLTRLTIEWFERKMGAAVLFVLSVLPFTAGVGFTMTPDAPLVACWAAALYFLHKAFLRQQSSAWYLLGLCLGLGFLSKYPMILLAAGIPMYMLIDRQSRHWFRAPQPYAAALIALLVFSPVLFWNSAHGWASFAFQGARRFDAPAEFSVHLWLLFLLLLLTPLGVYLAAMFFAPRSQREAHPLRALLEINRRLKLFVAIFSGLPLVVFAYASFTQEVKVNWLGPALLVLTPLLAITVLPDERLPPAAQRTLSKVHRGWIVTALVVLSLLQLSGYYLGIGIPGVPYAKAARKFVGWQELAKLIRVREAEIKEQTGSAPLVVGADSHYVPSELGFYRALVAARRGEAQPEPTQGRALVGQYSLMYHFWSDPKRFLGRTAIFVSRTETDLSDQRLGAYFEKLSTVEPLVIRKGGFDTATFYVRIGENYRYPEMQP